MNTETELKEHLERMRIESFALASNSATSPEFLKLLFEEKQPEPEVYHTEWVQPESIDDVEALLNAF